VHVISQLALYQISAGIPSPPPTPHGAACRGRPWTAACGRSRRLCAPTR